MKVFVSLMFALVLTFSVQAKEIILNKGNTVIMNQPFRASSVAVVQKQLADLAAKSGRDLYLVLNSPGGSISAGMALIDFANSLPNKVHTITIFAASMAYLTAQHLDKRYVVPSAQMMSHRARIGGLAGQVPGEANKRLDHIHNIVKELFTSTAKRVGVPYDQYLQSVYDELWLTAKQAVKQNHADEIIKARCDSSLSGTYESKVATLFGTFTVTFAECPLIQGPIKIGTSNLKIELMIKKYLNFRKKRYYRLYL